MVNNITTDYAAYKTFNKQSFKMTLMLTLQD